MDASNSLDAARIERKRKKKSRWAGTESEKTFIPGMPTVLPAGMTPDQQQAYLGESRLFLKFRRSSLTPLFFAVQLQIEEISRKLRTGDLGISQNPEERFVNDFTLLTLEFCEYNHHLSPYIYELIFAAILI